MAEVTAKNKGIGWLINFGIMMSYFRKLYILDERDERKRGKSGTGRTAAGNAYYNLINLLNGALASRGFSPFGITILTPPTTLDKFLADWNLLRGQLPGVLDSLGINSAPLVAAVDQFYNRWIAPKVPKT